MANMNDLLSLLFSNAAQRICNQYSPRQSHCGNSPDRKKKRDETGLEKNIQWVFAYNLINKYTTMLTISTVTVTPAAIGLTCKTDKARMRILPHQTKHRIKSGLEIYQNFEDIIINDLSGMFKVHRH